MQHRPTRTPSVIYCLSLCLSASVVQTAAAADWLHWRGPEQTGFSREKNLPDDWDPHTPGQDNLVWKQPYGCRSTPLVMNGKVYIIGAEGETPNVPTPKQKALIGERVVCFDAATGKPNWEQHFNVFHTDIVTNRLGWAPLAADPENKSVFAHTTAGFLVCFEAETGKIKWQRQLTEEFGRGTGYGGRLGGGPLFDSGLVIVGIVNASWGNQAPGANRLLAVDGKSGQVVWWGETPGIGTPGQNKGTYYSNPVVTVINGERLVITGGADGAAHAFQVRTGKRVWSYPCALGVINPAPVVDGNLVYICHGEENPEGAASGLGRIVCLDASKVENGRPKLVWEYRRGVRFGLSSPALADGKLYMPDDSAKLYCFDANKGKFLWKYNFGTVARGAPLVADGKIYVAEVNAKLHIIKLKEDGSEPDENETFTTIFRNRPGAAGFVEVNCTPSVADGRVYLGTRDELYCIAKPDAKATLPPSPTPPPEKSDGQLAQLQIIPAEVTLHPGESLQFAVRGYDAQGVEVKEFDTKGTWDLPQPPLPKGAKTAPPPLKGTIEGGKLTVDAKLPAQQGYVELKAGALAARARVRVAPVLPYAQDFEKVPEGAVPAGWVNAQGKFFVTEKDGSKVLSKVNNNPRPPVARANAYITTPDESGYTLEADLMGVEARGTLPDMGIVADRYTLLLDGKAEADGKRVVRLLTWEALTPRPPGRVSAVVPFDWQSGKWYRVKLVPEYGEQGGVIRGKVWERGQPEPEAWTVELRDPRPNRAGAAALYGYVSNAVEGQNGSEVYYDNIKITPHGKK
jgi:outer membrane protein assembly factor BamB